MTPDFAILAALIRSHMRPGDDDGTYLSLTSRNLATIMEALELAPVGRAAVAYHDRSHQPFDGAMVGTWSALKRAVEIYKETHP